MVHFILKQKKSSPTACCPQRTHFKYKDTKRLKIRDVRRYSMQVLIKKKAVMVTLISSTVNFKERISPGMKSF